MAGPLLRNIDRNSHSSCVAFYRRHLPHWHPSGKALFITWRLHQSIQNEHYLAQPDIATIVTDAIRYTERNLRYYDLHAWVVMSNHVHLLLSPLAEPAVFLNVLKSFTSRSANALLHRTGTPFWQHEYFDHWLRSRSEFDETVIYIESNPVRAGLVERPEDFRWSSAFISKSLPGRRC
jgi:REP element-mobilizing transposase RayT